MTPLTKKIQRVLAYGGHKDKGLVVSLIPGTQGKSTLSLRTKGCRDEVLCDFDWLWLQLNKLKAQESRTRRPGAARRRSTMAL